MDLIGDASPEDLQVLFGGLDNFANSAHLPSDNGFLSEYGNGLPYNNNLQSNNAPVGNGPLASHAGPSVNDNSTPNPWPDMISRPNHSAHHLLGACSLQLEGSNNSAPIYDSAQGSGAVFAMHQLHSVVNDLQTLQPSPQHSHLTSLCHHAVDHPP